MIFAIANLIGEEDLVLAKIGQLGQFGRCIVDNVADLCAPFCQERKNDCKRNDILM